MIPLSCVTYSFGKCRFYVSRILYLIVCAVILLSCSADRELRTANRYFNASTVAEKEKYMSPDYHSWLMEKKGDGEDKNAALASFQKWDGPLHPDVTILQSSRTGNSWMLQILEQNDFSKLIRFPGWRATVQLKVEEKKVNEIVYTPDADNPDYKKWLQPALEWLQKNRPNVLNEIYKNNRLVKSESAALEWVKLLREWREVAKVQQ